MKATDLMGSLIEDGDEIAYAITRVRSAVLATYKVLSIHEDGRLKAQQIIKGGNKSSQSRVSTLNFPSQASIIVKKWNE